MIDPLFLVPAIGGFYIRNCLCVDGLGELNKQILIDRQVLRTLVAHAFLLVGKRSVVAGESAPGGIPNIASAKVSELQIPVVGRINNS